MPATIRVATLDDAEQMRSIYEPYCLTPTSFELEPPSVDEMRQRIAKVLSAYPWLVFEQGGAIEGYVCASVHRERPAYRWSVDVTVYIRQEKQRKGIGRALYTSLFKLLVLQGYFNAYAGITLPNIGSVGLHEALGFQVVGVYRQVGYKCAAWHDVGWYQLRLQPFPPTPAPPRTLPEIQQTKYWEPALRSGLLLLRTESA
jgi:L-amino acid N-acyltransferase YncA